jgi:two-component system OmpR family sensor kinase
MNFAEFSQKIIAIEPNNIFLQYIVDRINDNNYRGLHVSQHNRYDLDRLIEILTGIYNIVSYNEFRIPLGDDTGENDAECNDYYEIVGQVKTISGVGTINSLKKNGSDFSCKVSLYFV